LKLLAEKNHFHKKAFADITKGYPLLAAGKSSSNTEVKLSSMPLETCPLSGGAP
jgi:hypothetical protein